MLQMQREYTSNFLKIFRPWDSAKEQDSTVTTTTELDTEQRTSPRNARDTVNEDTCPRLSKNPCERYENKQNKEDNLKTREPTVKSTDVEISTKKHLAKTKETKHKSLRSNQNIGRANQDAGHRAEGLSAAHFDNCPQQSVCPDVIHAHLAQSLGLSTADTLFLESVAHGYALEEYARVISQEQQAKLLSSRKQRPKKYKCPHCDVGFSNNGQLKGHIRIHTGERPFRCDEKNCGKTFTRNEELTRHKRIHSGLRPFPCAHCGKRFGRKDHLKKHTRTHVQHRPAMYAIPVMLPQDPWTISAAAAAAASYPYLPPIYGY